MRRWLRLQHELFRKARDSDHLVKGPVTLFDFADRNDAMDAITVAARKEGSWRISDDEVIGGFSKGNMHMISKPTDLERVENGKEPLPVEDLVEEEGTDSEFAPFVRWKGTIDTRIAEAGHVDRSGFCAIRSPSFPILGLQLLGKYNAIEVKCRTDGRQYLVNLKVDSVFPGDMYQAILDVPPATTDDGFSRAIFRFLDFQHTSGGRVRVQQRMLDAGANVETIGFTIMDGVDGDFQFDLKSIRAVNYYQDEILGEEDEFAPY